MHTLVLKTKELKTSELNSLKLQLLTFVICNLQMKEKYHASDDAATVG